VLVADRPRFCSGPSDGQTLVGSEAAPRRAHGLNARREVSGFPGVDAARARVLERIQTALGDDATDALVAEGAAMTYDESIEYALDHLDPAEKGEARQNRLKPHNFRLV
jgi:hypothetical protein